MRLGFDAETLVHEFFVLRRVLYRVLFETTDMRAAVMQEARPASAWRC